MIGCRAWRKTLDSYRKYNSCLRYSRCGPTYLFNLTKNEKSIRLNQTSELHDAAVMKRFPGRGFKDSDPKRITFAQYALLVCPVICVGLGTWQVQRRKWKLSLIKELEDKANLEAVLLPHTISGFDDFEYRRVKVTGKFDHRKEMYVGPRSVIVDGGFLPSRGLGTSGPSGYQVVTPFILSDRDETILVNRGWIPRKQKSPESRIKGQISEEVTLEGIFRLSEKRAPFMPKDTGTNGANGLFFYRDVDLMARLSGASPIFIDATKQSNVEGGPIGGQTQVTLRNDHLSYIFTWYSMAAVTSVLWYVRFVLKLK